MTDLRPTAKDLVAPGKGILAADESTGTIKKRFDSIQVEPTEETRRQYRELLFTTPGLAEYISGVILFDETIRQSAADGSTFVQIMDAAGIIPGIKVDTGAKPLAGFPGETVTEGLDGLRERLLEYGQLGARFAKWRATILIGDGLPTSGAMRANAHAMARYAALCQEAGIVPIVDEPLGDVESYGNDRLFVSLGSCPAFNALVAAGHPCITLDLSSPGDLGALVVTWEVATALAGAVLGINPFDQPNVAEAKESTRSVLAGTAGDLPMTSSIDDILGSIKPGDYVAIQAFVDPGSASGAALEPIRVAIRDRFRVATTLGFGPRFLHSTGQLHKGGAPIGVFLQIADQHATDALVDVAIPGQEFTFGSLINAQADGDLITLRHHGLRAARVTLDDLKRALA